MNPNKTYQNLLTELNKTQSSWLITGVAGFIGSNLLETLLQNNQTVVGLDNFETGNLSNLDHVKECVSDVEWSNFHLIDGDICNYDDCQKALEGVDYVLHQAALGSVPRSIDKPLRSNEVNIGGFLNILLASRDASVKSFTYAASSSTYGDHPALPKVEENIGNPLSPYAITKYVNELYAEIFSRHYGFQCIGLRYFNIFGKRQDPLGAYAAVIPKWANAMIKNEQIFINGDGKTSRDFTYVENAVQANIFAALSNKDAKNQIYNVAAGGRTTLNEMFESLQRALKLEGIEYSKKPIYRDFRDGDVKHSQADISKAKLKLGYIPEFNFADGVLKTMHWYLQE